MKEPARPHLTLIESGKVTIVEFTDRRILEELSIAEISEELGKLVQDQEKPKLLLSFSNVDHLSSAALGMLIKLNSEVKEKNGKLKLSDISPQIYEVFKITRLNKLFEIHETRRAAEAAF